MKKEELTREPSGFCCPVCGGPLEEEQGGARCGEGHRFDRARQGYFHLLPPNLMHSKAPGDTPEMVRARREFLEAGYYAPFRDRLCALWQAFAQQRPNSEKPAVLLDAGCGEGWYTAGLQGAVPEARVFGFDISKAAVKAAAGKYRDISFAVASCFHIPVGDSFCDCLTNVFAPIVPEEFRRVVKPGGTMILAVPSPRHLYGMKELLYEAPYENESKDTAYEGFAFLQREKVRGEISLPDGETALRLFAMTPYYWKTGRGAEEKLLQSGGFTTEIGFDFLVYRKDFK